MKSLPWLGVGLIERGTEFLRRKARHGNEQTRVRSWKFVSGCYRQTRKEIKPTDSSVLFFGYLYSFVSHSLSRLGNATRSATDFRVGNFQEEESRKRWLAWNGAGVGREHFAICISRRSSVLHCWWSVRGGCAYCLESIFKFITQFCSMIVFVIVE